MEQTARTRCSNRSSAHALQQIEQLAGAYTAVVSDALDRLGFRSQSLDPLIRPLYPSARLIGRVIPVVIETTDRTPEERYEGEISAVEALRPGDVPLFLVPRGNRAALWGELFSCAARGRGAVGVIVDGFVRDSRQVAELQFPVFCRGRSPLDTLGRAEVRAFGAEAVCSGVRVCPDDLVIADEDGVVIIPAKVFDEVVSLVTPKIRKESGARKDLLAGKSIRDVWKKYGVL